jgi:hypothetical protein
MDSIGFALRMQGKKTTIEKLKENGWELGEKSLYNRMRCKKRINGIDVNFVYKCDESMLITSGYNIFSDLDTTIAVCEELKRL